MADITSESLQLFNNYLVAVERRDTMAAVLTGTETVDDNVREAYELAGERLDAQVERYLERTPELIDGAAVMADRAGTAIDQLRKLEGILTPEELTLRYDRYRAPLQTAAAFMVEQCTEDDDRLKRVMQAADMVGGIVVQRAVQVSAPEPAAEKQATPAPEQATAPSQTPIVEQPAVLAPLPVAPETVADDELVAQRADEFMKHVGTLTGEFMTNDVWSKATGDSDVKYNGYRTSILMEAIRGRLAAQGKIIVHNGRVGRGSRYRIVDADQQTGTVAAPIEVAPTAVPTPTPEADSKSASYITLQDGLTLATFINMYASAIRQMELPVLPTATLDALLDIEQGSASKQAQDAEAIRLSREKSFAKIADLAHNPERLQQVLDALPSDDPRRAVIVYARQIAPHMRRLEPLLKGYYGMQLAVTVGRRSGWQVSMIDKSPLDKHGAQVMPREDTTSPAELALLAAVAAEESRPADALPKPLTAGEQQRIIDERPLAVLRNLALELATLTRRNNLLADRPYTIRRLSRVFPGLESMQLETRQGTAMVMEAIVHIASQQAHPLGLLADRTPEDLLHVIFSGIDEAYANGIQTRTRPLRGNPQPL